MNLVIDIGNTLTKVATIDSGKIINVDKYEVLSAKILDDIIIAHTPSKAIVSSVGNADEQVIKHLEKIVPTIIFDSTVRIPITNLYKTPQTLGLDRVAAVVGASSLYPSANLLVIDSGTAITYDLINEKAEYLGGAISPGIALRFKSLHQNTAKLPLLQRVDRYELIGTSTTECIESGVLNGITGEVDHYINLLKENYPSLTVVITGGDADFFVNKLKNSIFVHQNLVIMGLNRVLDFNAQ